MRSYSLRCTSSAMRGLAARLPDWLQVPADQTLVFWIAADQPATIQRQLARLASPHAFVGLFSRMRGSGPDVISRGQLDCLDPSGQIRRCWNGIVRRHPHPLSGAATPLALRRGHRCSIDRSTAHFVTTPCSNFAVLRAKDPPPVPAEPLSLRPSPLPDWRRTQICHRHRAP
jgi:hypothetical protein